MKTRHPLFEPLTLRGLTDYPAYPHNPEQPS